QPLQQLRGIGVVAELLQRRDLGADGNLLSKYLYRGNAALDERAARPWGLKADEEHQVPGIRKTLGEVVLDSASSHHAAGRDDDHGEARVVDLFGVFDFGIEEKIPPGKRRAVLGDEMVSFFAELLTVLR